MSQLRLAPVGSCPSAEAGAFTATLTLLGEPRPRPQRAGYSGLLKVRVSIRMGPVGLRDVLGMVDRHHPC